MTVLTNNNSKRYVQSPAILEANDICMSTSMISNLCAGTVIIKLKTTTTNRLLVLYYLTRVAFLRSTDDDFMIHVTA